MNDLGREQEKAKKGTSESQGWLPLLVTQALPPTTLSSLPPSGRKPAPPPAAGRKRLGDASRVGVVPGHGTDRQWGMGGESIGK